MTASDAPTDDAAPADGRVSAVWLLAGLALPPVAWIVEMLLGVGIASNACPLAGQPGRTRGFAGEGALLLAITLACLAATCASGVMSYRHWRSAKRGTSAGEPRRARIADDRARFMALAGMLAAATFGIAILFSLLEPIVIPLCWSAR